MFGLRASCDEVGHALFFSLTSTPTRAVLHAPRRHAVDLVLLPLEYVAFEPWEHAVRGRRDRIQKVKLPRKFLRK